MEDLCGACSVSTLTRQSTLTSTAQDFESNATYYPEGLHDEFRAVAARHLKWNGKKCDCLDHLIEKDDLGKATALLHSAQLYLFLQTDDTVANTKMDLLYKVLYGK
jgi:hypothetical protein